MGSMQPVQARPGCTAPAARGIILEKLRMEYSRRLTALVVNLPLKPDTSTATWYWAVPQARPEVGQVHRPSWGSEVWLPQENAVMCCQGTGARNVLRSRTRGSRLRTLGKCVAGEQTSKKRDQGQKKKLWLVVGVHRPLYPPPVNCASAETTRRCCS